MKRLIDPEDATNLFCREMPFHEQMDYHNPEGLVPGSGYEPEHITGVNHNY